MKKILLIFIISFISRSEIKAQNARFSQIYTAPVMLNPALAGRFQGNARSGMLLSWQNSKVTSIAHQNLYLDFKKSTSKKANKNSTDYNVLNESNYWGLNINYYQYGKDLIGFTGNNIPVNASFFNLTSSYHFNLSKDARYYAGIGIQITNADANLDESRGTDYDTEISGGGFRYRRTSSGNYKSNKGYFDYSLGMYLGFQTDEHLLEMGFALYHLPQPNNDLTGDEETRLRRRFSAYTNALFKVSNNRMIVFRNVYWEEGIYQNSTTYKDSTYITAFYSGIEFVNTQSNSNSHLNWGIMTRNFQSVIPSVNYFIGNIINLRLSYEVPFNNSVHPANNAYRTELFTGITLGRKSTEIQNKFRKNNMW